MQADIIVVTSKPRDGLSGYSMLLRNQNTILDEGQDLEALRRGLQQLPNLKRIMVLDEFEWTPDFHPFQGDPCEFDCFLWWPGRAFRDAASPTAWSTADCYDDGIHLVESPWDFRGVRNLLTAMEEQAPQLRHLSFGCQSSWLLAMAFDREDDAEALRRVSSQLISFKMHCGKPDTRGGWRSSDCVAAATSIIRESKYLESLTLTLDGPKTDWARLQQGIRCPGLKILDLCTADIDSRTLRAMFVAHGATLLELRLRSMHLTDGGSWEELSGDLGPLLHLQCITLVGISDKHGNLWCINCYKEDARAVKTAAHFMQQTPRENLRIGSARTAMTIAWNSKEFRPKFDLNRYCERFFSAGQLSEHSFSPEEDPFSADFWEDYKLL